MPSITLQIEVELTKTQGKFISKDELAEEIMGELEGADPGSVTVDESEYQVDAWTVSQVA